MKTFLSIFIVILSTQLTYAQVKKKSIAESISWVNEKMKWGHPDSSYWGLYEAWRLYKSDSTTFTREKYDSLYSVMNKQVINFYKLHITGEWILHREGSNWGTKEVKNRSIKIDDSTISFFENGNLSRKLSYLLVNTTMYKPFPGLRPVMIINQTKESWGISFSRVFTQTNSEENLEISYKDDCICGCPTQWYSRKKLPAVASN